MQFLPASSASVAIFCLILLINVMRVAVLSSPVPFGWNTQPPLLLLAFHLSYMLIAPVCVGGALFGHLELTRAWWSKSSRQAGPFSNRPGSWRRFL